MKILIFCDMFPPAFAPRMGYLCKYMKRNGWEPVVITEYIPDNTFEFLAGNTEVTYVRYYHASNKLIKQLEWLFIFIMDVCFHYKERKMIKVARELLSKDKYDGVLCSAYRTFPLPAAQKVASLYNIPFIADTRDIIEQYASNEYISRSFHTFNWLDKQITRLYRWHLLKRRNIALHAADYITTVSPWHVERMKQFNKNVKLIYNGYDPEIFFPKQVHTTQFRITYTGRLLSLAIRNPQLLFEAINKLSRENTICPETFRVSWYIDKSSQNIIEEEAKKHDVIQYMDYHGYVPASEIPDILNNSSVLLQLANKTSAKGPKGIMTTKLFEAFAVEKPVLCVRSDESYLEETINKVHAGIAAKTSEEVYAFLQYHYDEWKKKGYTTSLINREALSVFSRCKQAEQFMELFKQIKR
ncbi:glycosyltransferase [Parabacteroides chinchillae]|nr:glycosyltransferase [Parabacteroides chinchillae]